MTHMYLQQVNLNMRETSNWTSVLEKLFWIQLNKVSQFKKSSQLI